MNMKHPFVAFAAVLCAIFSGLAQAANEVTKKQVVEHYADLAHAIYADALISAKQLEKSIDTFLASPSKAELEKARQAWRLARIPYQQSEVFRFGNPVVDNWEGQLNAWPLDEGLIMSLRTTSTNLAMKAQRQMLLPIKVLKWVRIPLILAISTLN